MKKFLFLMVGIAIISTGCSMALDRPSMNTTSDSSQSVLKPRELLAASIEHTFGETNPNVFRYQRTVLAGEKTVSTQEEWSYQKNRRRDFTSWISFRTLDYKSSLTLDANQLWCSYGTNRNNAEGDFQTQPARCHTSTITSNEDSNQASEFTNHLLESVNTFTEPIETTEEDYQGQKATRSTYAFSRHEKGLSFLPSDTSEDLIAEFLILTEQQQVVMATYKEQTTGHFLYRVTIADDYAVTDVTPEEFFSQAYWENEMQDAEQRVLAFSETADAYTLPATPTGTIEVRAGKKYFIATAHPISFELPGDDWTTEIAEWKENSSEIITLTRPDPQEGERDSEYVFPNQALFEMEICQKDQEDGDCFQYLDEELKAIEARAGGEGLFGVSEVTSEKAVSLDDLQGKQYEIYSHAESTGEYIIETVVRLNDTTIIRMVGICGNGSDSEKLREDILKMENSITRE